MMKKGLADAFGSNESESMALFVQRLLGWYKDGGQYNIVMNSKGEVESWCGQMKVEVMLVHRYGNSVIFVDTTHNGSKYAHKAGPLGGIDCFYFTCPFGMMMIPSENSQVVIGRMKDMSLNIPEANVATDSGTAWPKVVDYFGQNHCEDTWHLSQNADKAAPSCNINRELHKRFKKDVKSALYDVMEPSELDDLLERMLNYTGDSFPRANNWILTLLENKEKRCATFTTRHFICSEKGATSRCESLMSTYKNGGDLKKKMRDWSFAESADKHEKDVKNYVAKATDALKEAILNEDTLAKTIRDKEECEQKLSQDLCILE